MFIEAVLQVDKACMAKIIHLSTFLQILFHFRGITSLKKDPDGLMTLPMDFEPLQAFNFTFSR